MSELKVEMTDTFSLAKSEMDNLLYRKSSMKAEKLVNEFNKACLLNMFLLNLCLTITPLDNTMVMRY